MRFACCVEKSSIQLGVLDGDRVAVDARVAARADRSADEYEVIFAGILALHGIDPARIDAAVLSSVVRPLTATVGAAIARRFGVKPLVVGPGVKTGLDIRTDVATQVGADLVANAVGALTIASPPVLVLDFGTATTLAGIDVHGLFTGVAIAPGVRTSLDALSAKAAELPRIGLEPPRSLFGRNTIDAMASGTVYGHAALADGLVARAREEWGADAPSQTTLLATGEWAESIVPHCDPRNGIRLVPELSLLGLKRIHDLNARPRTREGPA